MMQFIQALPQVVPVLFSRWSDKPTIMWLVKAERTQTGQN